MRLIMETLYVSPNRLQPIYNKNKFNYKGPRCFGIRGYRSATQESLRSTDVDHKLGIHSVKQIQHYSVQSGTKWAFE